MQKGLSEQAFVVQSTIECNGGQLEGRVIFFLHNVIFFIAVTKLG